jgi:hypothetical protein
MLRQACVVESQGLWAYKWQPRSRDWMTISIQRPHNKNMLLRLCGFRHLEVKYTLPLPYRMVLLRQACVIEGQGLWAQTWQRG